MIPMLSVFQDCRRRSGVGLLLLLLLLLGLLSGCSGTGDKVPEKLSDIPDAKPKVEPKSKYGNPKSYVVFGRRYYTKASSKGYVERGLASWYGKKFHGRKTSNGERYNMYAMTAAHKSLPLPTYVRVTNLTNRRSTVVRVNDRGPFHGKRIIDLSYSAARKLGMAAKGVAMVEVRAIDPGNPKSDQQHGFFTTDDTPTAKTKVRRKAVARKSDRQHGFFATDDTPAAKTRAHRKLAARKSDRQHGFLATDDTPTAKTKARRKAVARKSDRQHGFLATDDTPAAKTRARRKAVARKSDRQHGFFTTDDTPAAETRARRKIAAQKTPAVARPAPRPEKTATRVVKTKPSGAPTKGTSGRVADTAEPPAPQPKAAAFTTKEKPGPTPRSSLYLQVGAFGSRVNAEHLRRRLVNRIPEQIRIHTPDDNGTPWYKVQVGPLASRQSAGSLSRRLASLGLKGAHIVEE